MKKLTIFLLFFMLNTTFANNINYDNIQGSWHLKYKGPYGYEFRFKRNYTVYTILYLKTYALVFKGVYSIKQGNIVHIDITKIKNEESFKRLESNKNFINMTSSHFLFNANFKKIKNKKQLVLNPKYIEIDGKKSEGYFEPEIILTKK